MDRLIDFFCLSICLIHKYTSMFKFYCFNAVCCHNFSLVHQNANLIAFLSF